MAKWHCDVGSLLTPSGLIVTDKITAPTHAAKKKTERERDLQFKIQMTIQPIFSKYCALNYYIMSNCGVSIHAISPLWTIISTCKIRNKGWKYASSVFSVMFLCNLSVLCGNQSQSGHSDHFFAQSRKWSWCVHRKIPLALLRTTRGSQLSFT